MIRICFKEIEFFLFNYFFLFLFLKWFFMLLVSCIMILFCWTWRILLFSIILITHFLNNIIYKFSRILLISSYRVQMRLIKLFFVIMLDRRRSMNILFNRCHQMILMLMTVGWFWLRLVMSFLVSYLFRLMMFFLLYFLFFMMISFRLLLWLRFRFNFCFRICFIQHFLLSWSCFSSILKRNSFIECLEILSSIKYDILRLLSENFSCKIMSDVLETWRNWEFG